MVLKTVNNPTYWWRKDMKTHPWGRFKDILTNFQPKVGLPNYTW